MKIRIIKYLVGMALPLFAACSKEPVAPTPQEGTVIHYSATVSEGAATRASLNSTNNYIFSANDKLYVKSGNDMYGTLTLTSGAGEATAIFEGDLLCDDDFYPMDNTMLSAVLVSEADVIHTITDDKVNAERNYPTDAFATSFADAVSKYSDFIATDVPYGAHSISLNQQSAFLIFNVEVDSADDVSVIVKNGEDERTADVTPVSNENKWIASFVSAYPDGANLSGASVKVGTMDALTLHNATLAANHYYYINKPKQAYTGFTIRATSDNTTVTLNTYFKNDLQFSVSSGLFWEVLSTQNMTFVLHAGQTICLRSSRTFYNKRVLFTADKLCYIGGNIMSLMCTDNTFTEYRTSIEVENAFHSLFKNATWIDIDPTNILSISATTLTGPNCCRDMFNGCTSLTTAPLLPATTLSSQCYYSMFYNCTSLTTAPVLKAETLVTECYRQMFRGCSSLNYIKCLAKSGISVDNSTNSWVSGVASSGTFVKYTDIDWGNRSTHRIPTNWTVEEATQ